MEDVSDPPFRFVCKQNGADMMYTEFISSEGLIRDAAKSKVKLDVFDYERPVGIQLFGGNEDSLEEAARIAEAAAYDLIDINYGCPVHKVVSKGGGACLLQGIEKMVRLTEKVVKAVKLPVTVKTRLGWNEQTKHRRGGRATAGYRHFSTRHSRTHTCADVQRSGQLAHRQSEKQSSYPYSHLRQRRCGFATESSGNAQPLWCGYGVMIGRASIGYPWIFNEIKHYIATGELLPSPTISNALIPVKPISIIPSAGKEIL